MKIEREPALGAQAGIYWGLDPSGVAILVIVAGGERTKVYMGGPAAREVGCGAIYAGYLAEAAAANAKGVALPSAGEAGLLVDPHGNPMMLRNGGSDG